MVVLAKDVNVSDLVFGHATPDTGGITVVPVTTACKQHLILQTPQMESKAGMKSPGLLELELDCTMPSVKTFVKMLDSFAKRAEEFGNFQAGSTFTLSIPKTCPLFDSSGKRIPYDDLTSPGIRVTAIVECMGLWLIAGKCGLSWRVVSIRADPPVLPLLIDECADEFLEDNQVLVEM